MCGIVGVLGARCVERDFTVRRMCASVRHRGPDGEGIYEDDDVALGMRRLAIIDVACGAQPVYSESRDVVAVFNGEIYNFHALRDELIARGHVLASRSDSECIPHLYEEYGVDFVRRLDGMFTIALWDRASRTLLLARDRFGKKPLFYREDPGGLAFGSELKALLADPVTDRTVDALAVSHYLTYQYVPAPWSALAGVRKLPPAHVLVWRDGQVSLSRYWQLEYHQTQGAAETDEEELAEQLRSRLLSAVGSRMTSERPLGAFLSGGLDSSAIVAAMSRLSSEQVKTFSIGFDDDAYNELPFARQVATLYGTEHHEYIVQPDVGEMLPRLARSFDEPYADSSAIPSTYLAELARQHVVVALNGDGGDEALGGYSRYARFLRTNSVAMPVAALHALSLSGQLVNVLAPGSRSAARLNRASALLTETNPARRYAHFLSYFLPAEKAALFTPDFAARVAGSDSYGLVEDVWAEHSQTDVTNRLLAVDTYTYLPGDLLPKVDITTMSVSLEARSPLLDHHLVEWAASLPGHLKVRNGTTKYLFKKALEPWLPQELVHRRKMGFGVPMADWLRGPLREQIYDLLTDATARERGWFEPAAVSALLSEHMAGRDRSPHLYALLMLEIWVREVLSVPPKLLAETRS